MAKKIALQQAFDAGFRACKEYIDRSFLAFEERLHEIEARNANVKYVGVWNDEREYLPGNFCTFQGSVWHCNVRTRTRPGSDPTIWILAVKRGADARAAR
jgi:hypothetical protein